MREHVLVGKINIDDEDDVNATPPVWNTSNSAQSKYRTHENKK